MKAVRLENKISSGPQSQILEGVTWEEVNRLEDQKTADHTVIVGAASKGIIQKEYQHNAMVYKSAYAKNPFDNVTDEELEEYRRIVEAKQRGEPGRYHGRTCRPRDACSSQSMRLWKFESEAYISASYVLVYPCLIPDVRSSISYS